MPHTEFTPGQPRSAGRSLNVAFHSLGQRIGAFGSYLWMAEGYEAYFPPPCWLCSSAGLLGLAASEDTSTWSPEPLRAA